MDNEAAYIQEILEGDASRFVYFVSAHKGLAWSVAFRILGNTEDAEDVVQDAFAQAFRSLRSFKQESKFSTWLCRIVVNRALTVLKKRRAFRQYDESELAEEYFGQVESTYKGLTAPEQTKYINAALDQLVPEDRIILSLYYLEEQPLSEIALITGIRKENIKMKLHRARSKMYNILTRILGIELNLIS